MLLYFPFSRNLEQTTGFVKPCVLDRGLRLRALFFAFASGVAVAQTELSLGVILLGGFPKPFHCLRLIFGGSSPSAKVMVTPIAPGIPSSSWCLHWKRIRRCSLLPLQPREKSRQAERDA